MFREKQTSNGSGIIFFALTCVCILAAAYREEGKGLFG
jgi:cbb3-type cytochrome oxidase subunit 3